MTPTRFATQALPASQQFQAWRDWFDPVFDTVPLQPQSEGFVAESQFWSLNGAALSRVSAPALYVARTRRLIRRNPVDHWVVTFGRRVTTAIRTGDASVEAVPGAPFVLSLADELVSERSQDERLQLYLARDSFREIAALLDAARGMVLDTPLGNLLRDYLLLLEQSLPGLAPEDLPRLTSAMSAMVGACVVPTPDRVAEAVGQIDLTRLEKVRRVVRRHLRSPSLGPDLLCREVGMSRSQLYRLMEGNGGVARYIQRQRLLESHAVLADPTNAKPIAHLAEELCFADASAFSRAFRHEFGATPRDVRAGLALTPTPRDRIGRSPATLNECLHAF